MTFGFPIVTSLSSIQLTLTDLIQFTTDQDCGAYQVRVFKDSGLTTLSATTDVVSPVSNPTQRDGSTNKIPLVLNVNYDHTTLTIPSLYLKAVT